VLTQNVIFEGLKKLISKKKIISISGASGLGKTTLAQYLIGKLLINSRTQDYCSIWIQASEAFSRKRLSKIFEKKPVELEYIKNNVYIIPSKKPCVSYLEQNSVLKSIWCKDSIFSPDLRFIVIDNISHYLRFIIGQNRDISEISRLMDEFYDFQIWPLILFCKRNNVILILIHEVTFVPSIAKTRPFFYKLYDRIKTIDLVLSNVINCTKKTLSILAADHEWKFTYNLDQTGIAIS